MSKFVRSRRAVWGDARFLIGIAVVALSIGGVWAVVSSSGTTTPVLQATRTIALGEALVSEDFQVVEVGLGTVTDRYLAPQELHAARSRPARSSQESSWPPLPLRAPMPTGRPRSSSRAARGSRPMSPPGASSSSGIRHRSTTAAVRVRLVSSWPTPSSHRSRRRRGCSRPTARPPRLSLIHI